MPRLTSLTSSQLTGINITRSVVSGVPEYLSFTLDQTEYTENSPTNIITATVTTRNIDAGTTVGYTITGLSSSDLASGTLTGNITIGSNAQGTLELTISADGLTEGSNPFTITLAATDSAGTSTGTLSDTATILDTSNDPAAILWLDDNDNPTTVRTIIGATSMQINGVFAANPSVPRTIQGRTSGAETTITAITARTDTFIEVDDTGNSASFVVGEQLNLI